MSYGMPLDLLSPARHAATEIERVAPVALSVSDLAETYRHPNTGDVSRARVRAGGESEHDANCWLIEQALEKLQYRGKTSRSKVQLVNNDGKWRFADDVTFDDLLWDGKVMHRTRNEHKVLGDPFDKMTGEFSDNIRALGKLDDLRESMEVLGWIDDPIFNALTDENGVVLVGHRRMAVAKELSIEPRTRPVFCGVGDEADLRRFQLALASNIGRKDMSSGERQNIVKVLAGPGHDWTQMSIAAALGVSQMQISRDIQTLKESGELNTTFNSGKPKRGRPPGAKSEPKPDAAAIHADNPVVATAITDAIEAGVTPQSVAGKQLAKGLGIPSQTFRETFQRVAGRVEAEQPIGKEPEPTECTCTCPVHCP